MSVDYDNTDLAKEADEKIRTFQADAAREAGIFHHLITLPTYHTAALSTDTLAKGYFADQGMLAYVKNVQREEIRNGIACVKHQNMAGSDIGDNHKEYFAGEAALKAGGLTLADMGWIELNEAFAAQSLAVIRDLGLNPDVVNPMGGAIALGHPLGATGAIRAATVVHALRRHKLKYGMVTMCVGTGQGAAGIFESL
jgi:hypothetical protein